eukprot:1191099-Prorocentrum_minimum.AAC.4
MHPGMKGERPVTADGFAAGCWSAPYVRAGGEPRPKRRGGPRTRGRGEPRRGAGEPHGGPLRGGAGGPGARAAAARHGAAHRERGGVVLQADLSGRGGAVRGPLPPGETPPLPPPPATRGTSPSPGEGKLPRSPNRALPPDAVLGAPGAFEHRWGS